MLVRPRFGSRTWRFFHGMLIRPFAHGLHVGACEWIRSSSKARASTTSRTSTSRSRATSSSSSPGCPARASRRSRSTPSTPRASAATSSRCRPTRASSSSRWASPTSTPSRACRRPSPSSRSRPRKNPRSTVGTVTEIYDYLRLLYARIGTVHCCNCGQRIASQTVQQMVDRVLELPEGTRFSVLAPVVRDRKGEYAERARASCARTGFVRANIDGELRELAEPTKLDKNKKHTIEVFVDRLVRQGRHPPAADRLDRAGAQAGRGASSRSRRSRATTCCSPRSSPASSCGISLPRDRAAHVLVQQPARRLPGLRRHRRQDVLRPRPHRARRRAVAARGRDRAVGEAQQRPSSSRSSTRSPRTSRSTCTRPGTSCPHEHAQAASSTARAARRSSSTSRRTARKHTLQEGVRGRARQPRSAGFDEYERRRREQGRTSEEDFEAIYDEFHRYMNADRRARSAAARACARRRASSRSAARRIVEVTGADRSATRTTSSQGLTLSPRAEGRSPSASCARSAERLSLPRQRRPRLPDARPHRGDAVGRRGAAHPAGDADRQLAGGRALHPRRAVDRPAPARQRAPARDAAAAARPRQHRARRRARRGDHPRRRPRHRHGPARRRARRAHRRRRHARGHQSSTRSR